MQFTERSPVLIGLVAFALTAVFTVVGLALNRSHLVGGYQVVAEFSDANGMRAGDHVFVAGVRAGRVLRLDIVEDRVEALLQIDGAELPATSRAQVQLQTLVGRRGVDIQAVGSFDELLEDGDRIPLERTRTAIDVPTFGETAEELLSEVDAEVLNTFLRGLSDLTEGQRQEVAQLVEGGTRLTDVVTDQEEQVRELLRQLRGVVETLNARDAELVAILDSFEVALGEIAARRDDLRRLFRETNATSAQAADLVADKRAEIDRILDDLHRLLTVVDRHQLDLAEALAYSGDAIVGFSSIAFAGPVPVPWGHVFVTSLGPAGVDVLIGCGGLLDRQLDAVLGPDPRSCEEQENQTIPEGDDTQGIPTPLPPGTVPRLPVPPGGPAGAQRFEVDALARRLLPPAAGQEAGR
jgi:phospholipid/cholesterol/gamma-HCH transport system substrate-binding protein